MLLFCKHTHASSTPGNKELKSMLVELKVFLLSLFLLIVFLYTGPESQNVLATFLPPHDLVFFSPEALVSKKYLQKKKKKKMNM